VLAGEPDVTSTVALYGNVFCRIEETVEHPVSTPTASMADKTVFFIIFGFKKDMLSESIPIEIWKFENELIWKWVNLRI